MGDRNHPHRRLQIYLPDGDKEALQEAAEEAGMGVSEYLRATGLKAAKRAKKKRDAEAR